MGAGGSVASKKPSDIKQADIDEIAEKMDPEALEVMKKIVAAAEEHQKKPKASTSGGAKLDPIKKVGNSEEATEMQRAVFMWDESTCKKVLPKLLGGKVPEKVNGAMLVMEQVEWEDKKDEKKWAEGLKDCAWKWMCDQPAADKPFDPPASAKEHCVYLWNEKEADAWLTKLKVKPAGQKGSVFMDDVDRNEHFDFESGEKVYEALKEEAVLFLKAVVKAA